MHQDVCNLLRKVKTPPKTHVLRGAGTNSIHATACCTAQIVIQEQVHTVEFLVLPQCTCDIILGWDFLNTAQALVDCANSEIWTTEIADLKDSSLDTHIKLCTSDDIIVSPCSTTLVGISAPLNISADVLLEPHGESLARKGLILPHCIASLHRGMTSIPITNGGHLPLLLPKGFSMARAQPFQDTSIAAILPDSSMTYPKTWSSSSSSEALFNTIDKSLPSDQQYQLYALLQSYKATFDHPSSVLGKATAVEHRIETGDAPAVRHRPYRVSLTERRLIQHHVEDMIVKGVVRPSSSPWSSPVVLIRKKDGSIRFCVDYRRLNKITRKDVYPLPRIDDALDTLQGSSLFSCLDLRSGYWQIPMAEQHKAKTAFATPDGLYEFNVMPFGLSNAPATFERMIDSVLRGMKWSTCLCYLDDIIVFSATFEEHLSRLSQVLSCINNAGLQLNTKKCHFAARKVKVLGHIVTHDGVAPDPEKIRAVVDFPSPQNAKELRSFLGLASYFRRFVKGFATIAAPLHYLLRGDVPFDWDTACVDAFTSLRRSLASPPILCHFNPLAPTDIHTDASGHGLGAVLIQRSITSNQEQVIAYASRTLSKPEINYSTTERECLAVVWAITKFRPYLYGRHFEVVSDHHALCWLSSLKNMSGRLGRWTLQLQEYDFTVRYKSGRKHSDADSLSRCPLPPKEPCVVSSCPADSNPILATISLDSFGAAQRSDAWISPIVEHINRRKLSTNTRFLKKIRDFAIHNGLLYKHNYSPDGQRWLLVVPSSLRREILQCFHDHPTAAHFGLFKTYARIRQRYFWPGMYRTVANYVQSCAPCQLRKRPSSPSSGLLQPIEPPRHPFEVVGIDIFGPLPLSAAQHRYIVVAIDHATRYVETASLYDATAEAIAPFILNNVILRHGAPRVLISDRGKSFLSRTVEAILQASKVNHRLTSPYHPQTNGLTERFNHTLADMLSMYISETHSNWDTVLPFITFAYNTAVQSTTGFSPFYLLHGREPSTTLDTILPYPPHLSGEETLSQASYRTEACRQLARTRTLLHQQASKRYYDERHQDRHFAPDDRVLIYFPLRQVGRSEKLLPKYQGPYRVIQQTSPVNYLVEPEQHSTDRRTHGRHVVHVSRLKLFTPRDTTP